MRVLIDACLPVQFKEHLAFANVSTAREMGWQDLKNGDLLTVAQHRFDVLLTMDKGMPSQQFLRQFSIGLLILRAQSNRLADLLPLVPAIVRTAPQVKKGQALIIS